jgi:hypothetical protein
LFKIATQGISLWHFRVYLVHLFYFSSFYFSLSLMVVSISLRILYLFLHREYINLFTLTSFFYPPLLMCDLPLVGPVFHNIATFVLGLYSTYERKHAASEPG